MRSLFDRFWRILAEAMPARLVYFVAMRILHSAVDEFHADVPPRFIPFLEAVGVWKEGKTLAKLPDEDRAAKLEAIAPVAALAQRRSRAASPLMTGASPDFGSPGDGSFLTGQGWSYRQDRTTGELIESPPTFTGRGGEIVSQDRLKPSARHDPAAVYMEQENAIEKPD